MIQFAIDKYFQRTKSAAAAHRIFLCLERSMSLQVGGEISLLQADDLCLVQAGSEYEIEGNGAKAVRFDIDPGKLRSALQGQEYEFHCNSSKEVNDNYAVLRKLLTEYLLIFYEGRSLQEIEKRQKAYEILLFLVNHFGQPSAITHEVERIQKIFEYIEGNYKDPVTLEQIAGVFSMSAPYFSKFFKTEAGITFYKYLNRVRTQHATYDMEHTKESMTQVALRNGFSNTEAFYRYFQEFHGIRPQEYRENFEAKRRQEQHALQLELQEVFEGNLHEEESADTSVNLTGDADCTQAFIPPWEEMANLARIDKLSDYTVRKQLEQVQQALGFSYLRTGVQVPDKAELQTYSFYREEQYFDFLTDLRLQLWFHVEYREVKDWDSLYRYLEMLLSYFSNRYSIGNVRKWRVELTYDTVFSAEKCEDYWLHYDRIQAILNRYQMESPLFGPGLSLGNLDGVKTFCRHMEETGRRLEYQTFQVHPYSIFSENGEVKMTRSTDAGYIRNMLLTLRRHANDMIPDGGHIFITGWQDSITNLSAFNDLCYKGCYIIKNMLDCIGDLRGLGHEVLLDTLYDQREQGGEFFGAGGLMSKRGIAKPSFYAYSFLKRMGKRMLVKSDNGIVVQDEYMNFHLLCHNYKHLNYKYYMDETRLREEHIDNYYADTEPLEIHLHLDHIQNGIYIIKRRSVSDRAGSAKDLMNRMLLDKDVYVHVNDFEYIKTTAVPEVTLDQLDVSNHTMDLNIRLEANEFAYVHLIYQY